MVKPPPWIHTMTGSRSLADFASVETLSVRQSSLDATGGGVDSPAARGRKFVGCGHCGPNCVASRTVVHGSGATGGRHRRAPVGAAAYGMPLNMTTSLPLPRTGP